MVLIDLDQPGIEVRPIRAEDGDNHFSEIFLDHAYVPSDRIVGEIGGGWAVAMYMLQWERGAWGWLQQGRFHNRLEFALPKYNMYRRALARVLAEDFVRPGVLSEAGAVDLARHLLRDNVQRTFKV